MSTPDPVLEAFAEAQLAFRKNLKDPRLYDEILTTTKVADVYEAAGKLQETALKGRLRYVGKIGRFLERLSSYAAVIEVFVQVKPDVLALIWGPIKLLLQWSSQLTKALDQVIDVMEQTGWALPQFAVLVETFEMNDAIRAALALFYEDILDLYRITLDFFRKTRWKQMFEVVWPKYQPQLDVVVKNLKEHADLLRNEATVLDIQEAHKARLRSISHFSTTQTFQERQKFFNLKARVSAELYDEALDWFRNRSVADCGKWLFRDPVFTEWLDSSRVAVTWLWLQGIPGAGKTYLSATVVDHARKQQHRTLFVFASHLNKTSLTALSVIQSLIFQAAEDDDDFQSLLVESKERELQGNVRYASEMLGTFLRTATGPTYLVIDGLDEMDEYERQILLQRLEGVSKDGRNIRILISSRMEDDISRIIDQKSENIKVNDRNYGSIQKYIDHRSHDWMTRRQFDPSTQKEMVILLSPLSNNARGMFLYARIILDRLEQMSSIDEIRDELKALPIDLNDAYYRIFQRINDSTPQMRSKCRKILAWVECAPIPLTVYEMEQALSIDVNPDKKLESVPQVLGNLNFTQMCGPIVEVVGEKLQFVHFTVSEYIFSSEIRNFIDKAEATRLLLSSFLAYLSSDVLEPDLDLEEFDEKILTGQYRLFQYASFYWPALISRIETLEGSGMIEKLLCRLLEMGRNDDFENDTESPVSLHKFEHIRSKSPEVYDMLCATFKFHLDNSRWEWKWNGNTEWVERDPLTTSQMLVRIQKRYDDLVSDDASAQSIRRQYGSCIFKCTHPFCAHSRRGFVQSDDLKAHLKKHGRPWKCTSPSCEFCHIGFCSRKNRDDHWLKYHLPAVSQLEESSDNFESLDPEEVQPMLFGLVIEGDTERVKQLLGSSGGKKLKTEVIAGARQLAATELGSLAMIELLTPLQEEHIPPDIVISAVKSGDAEFVKWSLAKARPKDCGKFMKVMLGAESEEIYTLWEEYILKNVAGAPEEQPNPESKIPLEHLFKQTVWNEVKKSPVKEKRLKRLLRNLRNHLGPQMLGAMLVQIARSSCSVSMSEELLRLGAPIDYPWECGMKGMSAIQAAAKQTTEEAAHLMRFLVFKGARTTGRHYKKSIAREKGAVQIVTWLGITWAELQEEYQASVRSSSGTSHEASK